jgi:hypothetical protein
MKNYSCEKCGMKIKNLVCAKCNSELMDKAIDKEGKKIHVAQCEKCQGMVKSPQCCGSDMKYS